VAPTPAAIIAPIFAVIEVEAAAAGAAAAGAAAAGAAAALGGGGGGGGNFGSMMEGGGGATGVDALTAFSTTFAIILANCFRIALFVLAPPFCIIDFCSTILILNYIIII
jgi:hypothetical protein